ncbi:MAG: hypothetical protein K5679_01395 [Lachnospiraceae bacterium]|nr:hypothetical protein [Lachnospiraceae bacterium]
MKNLTSRQKLLFAVYGMLIAIVGDYLLGYGTFSTSNAPGSYMGMTANVVPDWRYALSSILGFVCAALFAVGACELFRVMEIKYKLADKFLYKLFKVANWGGILYFAFIHIGICMLPVVFNAGMEATDNMATSIDMTIRVLKSIAVPMIAGFIICDGFVTVAWIGMVIKKFIPVKLWMLICTPLISALVGQLMNYVAEGMDSGFESFGWLLMYLVCALKLVEKGETV